MIRKYKLTIRTMADSWNDEWEKEFDTYEKAKEFADRLAQSKPYLSWLDEDWDTIFIFTDKIIDMLIDSFEVNNEWKEKWAKWEWIGLVVMLVILWLIWWKFTVDVVLPALWK